MTERKKELIEATSPTPIVVSGLWGNPNHHRYTMLKDVFTSAGTEGVVIGSGSQVDGWQDFEQTVNEGLQVHNLNQQPCILIGNSVGGTFMLKYLHEHPETTFEQVFLIGFNPDYSREHIQEVVERQQQVWLQLNIPQSKIDNLVHSFNPRLQRVVEESIEHFKDDERVTFIHGSNDQSEPLETIIRLHPKNLHVIPGLGHNAPHNLEKALQPIWSKTLGVDFVPVMDNQDLLSLDPARNYAGYVPFHSGNRIGWALIGGSGVFFRERQDEMYYCGRKKDLPEGYTPTAEYEDKVYAVNLDNLQQSGLKFYPPLLPQRSLYPEQSWTGLVSNLKTATSENQVETSKTRNRSEKIAEFQQILSVQFGEVYKLIEPYMDSDNRLLEHIYDVYQMVSMFGISQQTAISYAFLHDVGKGLFIWKRQLDDADTLLNSGESADQHTIRTIGSLRKYATTGVDKEGLAEEISQRRSDMSLVDKTFGLIPEEYQHDRSISLKIFQFCLDQGIVTRNDSSTTTMEAYLQGKNTGELDLKLIKLADMVAPYLASTPSDEITIERIKQALELRTQAASQLYGKKKSVDDYLDQPVLMHLKAYFK